MFLGGLNTDDHKIYILEKMIFIPTFKNRNTCPGQKACGDRVGVDRQPGMFWPLYQPCSGSMGVLTELQAVLLLDTDTSGVLLYFLKIH